MRKRSLLLLTGLVALVGSLVIGPAATATTEGASAGTVVIIHDQEPGIINNFLSEGNGYTVSLFMNTILASGADLRRQGRSSGRTSWKAFRSSSRPSH